MLRTGGILLLSMIVVWSATSAAFDFLAGEARYRIDHEMFGTIGEERLTFHRSMGVIVVDRTVEVDVRFLMASLHRRSARYTEVWQGERLISFQGRTDDNGDRTSLEAEAAAGSVIKIRHSAPSSPIEASPMTMPTDPWHVTLIHRTLLFDRLSGRLERVRVVDLGADRLSVDGQVVETHRYAVSGRRNQEFWFDDRSGLWLRSTIRHASGEVTITRYALSLSPRIADVDADAHGS